ncbi:site-specific integrase [Allopusillimonas ginsengisoli]|nr:site-specific integrase [Allopusillimonas ginsengisoli]
MGTNRRGIAPASDSSIQISFQYRGQRCREKIKLKPTPANLIRAERHRAAILLAIENGTFDYAATFPDSPRASRFAIIPGQAKSVEDYLTEWLKARKKHLKASTHEDYRKIVDNLLIPQFGQLMLVEIKRPGVRKWLDTMAASNKRLANIQSVLRKALSDAVDDDLIDNNPLAQWCYKRAEAPKSRDLVDPFSPEEQRAIIAKCPPPMANQVQFALWTGLRTSELVALRWNDIDFVRGVIIIDKAITHAAKGKVEDTKTTSGRREVKLLSPARQALKAQQTHTLLANGAVFTHPTKGTQWTGDQEIRKYWVQLLRRAGVRYRRPYQTRHTYASMMLSAGEHPMWVAAQMGHSDWTMIARVYGRWMPAADVEAGGKAEAKFCAPEKLKKRAV